MIVDISLTLLEQIFRQVDLMAHVRISGATTQQIYFTLSLAGAGTPLVYRRALKRCWLNTPLQPDTLAFAVHTETLPKIHNPHDPAAQRPQGPGHSLCRRQSSATRALPIQKLREIRRAIPSASPTS